MNLRQIMQKELVTAQPTSSVQEVARKMKEHNVGSVLIVDEGWKLKGILTDRDIALAIGTESKQTSSTWASDIMTQDPLTAESEADFDSALRIMSKGQVRRLPVTENGKLVGIVSAADVACAFKEQFNQFIGLEEAYTRH